MTERFSRNELFWGSNCRKQISEFHIAVFGLGGVGGHCAEALARSGVGKLSIIDFDTVSESNINRQIIALNSTVKKKKTELFKERFLDINPDLKLEVLTEFYSDKFPFTNVDYVADAIDTMRSKISLLEYCVKNSIPIISSMGAGNRVNPENLIVCDLSDERIKTQKDVFAKNIVYQLKTRDITSGITFVTSTEKPFVTERKRETEVIKTKTKEITFDKIIPSSTPFVAPCAGIFMASYIIRKLCKL